MRRRNIIAAVVLIVCGLIYGYLTTGVPERSLPNTPGPPFFPWIVTVIVLTLSIALLVQGLVGAGDSKAPATPVAGGDAKTVLRAVLALAVFVAYLAVLPWLGFVLATAPFFAVLMVLYGERRWWAVLAGAAVTTIVLYVVFRHGFGVFLPQGILRGILP